MMEKILLIIIILLLVFGYLIEKLTKFIEALKPFIHSSKLKYGFTTSFSFEPIHKKREVCGGNTTPPKIKRNE